MTNKSSLRATAVAIILFSGAPALAATQTYSSYGAAGFLNFYVADNCNSYFGSIAASISGGKNGQNRNVPILSYSITGSNTCDSDSSKHYIFSIAGISDQIRFSAAGWAQGSKLPSSVVTSGVISSDFCSKFYYNQNPSSSVPCSDTLTVGSPSAPLTWKPLGAAVPTATSGTDHSTLPALGLPSVSINIQEHYDYNYAYAVVSGNVSSQILGNINLTNMVSFPQIADSRTHSVTITHP